MKNLIIILIIIALVVGAYRFVSSRKKGEEQRPVEIIETEMTPTPTLASPEEPEQSGQDLPSAGGPTEVKEKPSEEELQKMIREFELEGQE